MSHSNVTGTLHETHGEVLIEWQIADFHALSEVGGIYDSPVFYACDACWALRINPRGQGDNLDWVGLHVKRMDSGSPKEAEMSFGFKTADTVEVMCQGKITINWGKHMYGAYKCVRISDLMKRKSELTPSDVLTVIFKITDVTQKSAEVSLFSRLWDLSRDLKTMLTNETRTDFVLKLEGREVQAHRAILEARCCYFSGMLGNDFRENTSGEGDFSGIEEGVFQCVLTYLYTGEAEGMSDENVCKIYAEADKLLLVDLKKMCTCYMRKNLKLDLICDVIAIAEMYDEVELKKHALDYFTEHADEVFELDAWKKFKEEHDALVPGLLEKIIVRKMKHLKA